MQNGAPPVWLETNDMRRFYVYDLKSCLATNPRGSMNCVDANGVPTIVAGRTKACLRMMFPEIYDQIMSRPKQGLLTRNDVVEPGKPYLYNTFSVVIR
ncbi:MAG: hypothetical protein Hyperionvirus38_1 [Hyperionvirus sp.]|uniref:Uncharacterized protein n=1 Tax=Hyperionvirus sp. TaxID=2487770 RepID=A0A3G5AFU4_9VIRU|nr:MAG: hypothetical protein Hyperionvirus38_1 [Hyperionvirus sp.]